MGRRSGRLVSRKLASPKMHKFANDWFSVLLELEIKHKHGGFNIHDEKATVVWQQFGLGS
jgi:hypothetical protein